jgi:hypothetical protein
LLSTFKREADARAKTTAKEVKTFMKEKELEMKKLRVSFHLPRTKEGLTGV